MHQSGAGLEETSDSGRLDALHDQSIQTKYEVFSALPGAKSLHLDWTSCGSDATIDTVQIAIDKAKMSLDDLSIWVYLNEWRKCS